LIFRVNENAKEKSRLSRGKNADDVRKKQLKQVISTQPLLGQIACVTVNEKKHPTFKGKFGRD